MCAISTHALSPPNTSMRSQLREKRDRQSQYATKLRTLLSSLADSAEQAAAAMPHSPVAPVVVVFLQTSTQHFPARSGGWFSAKDANVTKFGDKPCHATGLPLEASEHATGAQRWRNLALDQV